MNLDGTKQVVGRGITVCARQRLDELVPSTFGWLLDIAHRPRGNLGDGFGEQFGPGHVHLALPAFECNRAATVPIKGLVEDATDIVGGHAAHRAWGAQCG